MMVSVYQSQRHNRYTEMSRTFTVGVYLDLVTIAAAALEWCGYRGRWYW